MSKKTYVEVELKPSGQIVKVPEKSLVTDILLEAGHLIPLDCGGEGTCGRCLVQIAGEIPAPLSTEMKMVDRDLLDEGWRLACQCRVTGNISVSIPAQSEELVGSWHIHEDFPRSFKPERPVIISTACRVPEPGFDDLRSDSTRVMDTVSGLTGAHHFRVDHYTAGQITREIRTSGWEISVFQRDSEIVGVAPRGKKPLGLAVDLGSTKLAVFLIDLESGDILSSLGRLNPQVFFGADIVTRLHKGIRSSKNSQRMRYLVCDALNSVAGVLAKSVGARKEEICEMSVVGNSAMIHLFLGWPLEQLAAPPFIASLERGVEIKARELGIHIAPGAYIHIPPMIGGFVGSDNVAMIIGADFDRSEGFRLGLDIGTNTEVVFSVPGNDHLLYIASAPSGPAFEGAHLSSGMRATAGAVSRVRIGEGENFWETIEGDEAVGICGSGIIDAVAEMLRGDIIDSKGHLDRSLDRVKGDSGHRAYVLVPGEKSATGRDICITQSDISQVQLAKAAINAAVETLLSVTGTDSSEIAEVVLAGSFGSHFDIENARSIGLVPDLPGASYVQVGNAAGKGACQLLNCRETRKRADTIPQKSKYIELTAEPRYNTLFARSLHFTPKIISR